MFLVAPYEIAIEPLRQMQAQCTIEVRHFDAPWIRKTQRGACASFLLGVTGMADKTFGLEVLAEVETQMAEDSDST